MVSSMILAIGRLEIEDGPRIGNQFEAGNSLHRVCTIHEIGATIDSRGRVDQVHREVD